jgi:drug/metabolite transporter (DMT)-like permease
MTKWMLVGVIVACNSCADLMSTAGMRQYGKVHQLNPSAVGRLLSVLAKNRFVVGGVVANAIGFFTLMSLLSIAEVSFAVPATAASFVLEAVLARLILKEDVRWQRWLGVVVIACGVALLALP